MDTNAIIEAVRTECWKAIAHRFRVETVEKCIEEAMSGESTRPAYVKVTAEHVALIRCQHLVTRLERATLALQCPSANHLDDGERDLIAHALGRDDESWLLCSPDKAAVRAAVQLDVGDRLTSVEELASQAGMKPKPPLYDHHTQARLVEWRTAARLGTL